MDRNAPAAVSVRVATPADHVAASRVLDGALLEVPDLRRRIEDGVVLVATASDDADGDPPVVGATVVAPEGPNGESFPDDWPDAAHLRAIAVRRRYRRRGIGAALVDAALGRWDTLIADYETDVDPFYAALDAERTDADDGRRWALLDG